MKKRILVGVMFVGLVSYAMGQDCFKSFETYYSSIDTTDRPVFQIAEKMPEILNGEFVMKILPFQSQLFDSLQCCPIRVWIGVVVEPDSTLTNIQICTKMMFCNDESIVIESEKFNERMNKVLSSMKFASGELDGEKVAVACIIPIHFECREKNNE